MAIGASQARELLVPSHFGVDFASSLRCSRALNFSANKPKDMSSAARVYKQKQETLTNTQTHILAHTHTLTATDTLWHGAGSDQDSSTNVYMLEVLEP